MRKSLDKSERKETTLLLSQSPTNYSGNRRTRSPPYAQLETLSSWTVWAVLFLPFLLAAGTVFIDLNKSIHRQSFRFSIFDCPHPTVCDTANNQLHVLVNTDVTTLHHVTLKGKMKSFDDSIIKYGLQVIVVGNDESGMWTQTFLEVMKSNLRSSNGYWQIGGFSTDRPWLLPETKHIRLVISVSNADAALSMDLLEQMTFRLTIQSQWFCAIRALLQIILGGISLYCLVVWSRRLATHHIRLRESATTQGLLRASSYGTRVSFACCCTYLVSEQVRQGGWRGGGLHVENGIAANILYVLVRSIPLCY